MLQAMRCTVLALLASALAFGGQGRAQAPSAKPLSEADVVNLIKLLDDDAVIARLGRAELTFSVDEAVVERLKKAGATPGILAAVRRAGGAGPGGTPGPAVTFEGVLKLLELGIPERDIFARLENSPTLFVLDSAQEAKLKNAGASDKLLAALRSRGGKTASLPEATDFAIILDCSGSMIDRTGEGSTKMDVAKDVVTRLVEAIPNGRRVTFIIYGHDADLKCKAVKVVRRLSELDDAGKAELRRAIAGLRPVGHTPIALALRVAGEELARGDGNGGILLITDGMETCHGDPNAEAAKLAANPRLTFGIQVIGFDVEPKERQAVQAIAEAGKGKFHDARTPEKLRADIAGLQKRIAAAAPEPAEPEDPNLPEAVKALIQGLKDKEGSVRRTSAESLGKMGARARGAVPALARRVADDVWIGGVFAHTADPHGGGKAAALEALKKLAPDRVEETLLLAMKSKNPAVKSWATGEIALLQKEGSPSKDKEGSPSKDADKARQEDAPKLAPAVQALVDGLTDKEGAVRRTSAESLGKMGARARGAVPALARRVADDVWIGGVFANTADPHGGGKAAALEALKKLAPDRVEETLLLAMRSKNPAVKSWATTELGRQNSK
jgi:Mg-chelatase subunit ChlD